MSVASLVGDDALAMELKQKLPDLLATARALSPQFAGLESTSLPELEAGVEEIVGGTWVDGSDLGLEAIVNAFARPVLLVQDGTFGRVPDAFEESEEIRARLMNAKAEIEAAIPSVGRINLTNHRMDWVGTGWLAGPQTIVTNQHVATEFAKATTDGFGFRTARNKKSVKADVDLAQEYDRGTERLIKIDEIIWVEDEESLDVAILHVEDRDDAGQALPDPMDLMTAEELTELVANSEAWIAVIGYPARSIWNDPNDQQRIFDGIYGYKRLAPGKVMGLEPGGERLNHDATTLGGNSGSAIVDLTTGKVAGLHFGGSEGVSNEAVQAPAVKRILTTKLG